MPFQPNPKIDYAHTHETKEWETLEVHLEIVANLAKEFADKFGAGELGWLAGAYHDLGKQKEGFQLKIRGKSCKHLKDGADWHASEGAQTVLKNYPAIGHWIAPLITAHHSGLANGDILAENGIPKIPFTYNKDGIVGRLESGESGIEKILNESFLPSEEEMMNKIKNLVLDKKEEPAPFRIQFFMRILFSCLIDADRIATEAFCESISIKPSYSPYEKMKELKVHIDNHMNDFSVKESVVNILRNEVLQSARKSGISEKGFFTMTVPTGGGKTLSSMAFALEHAIRHEMDRIIYVIPFTSIIEQNAQKFRDVFGESNVLEHHSAFDEEHVFGKWNEEIETHRRHSENWDSPIVVTTAVQFFESLFTNKTSKCRKLHNMTNSVIVFDEAQTLPVNLLRPCLAAISTLVECYRSTAVLCTATQPAILKSSFPDVQKILPEALPEEGINSYQTREIAADPDFLNQKLKRVRYQVLENPLTHENLVVHLANEENVLCILNNRQYAMDVFERLNKKGLDGVFHLSTNMCIAHRRAKLREIKNRLEENLPVRLVSTSLIEAGVDIDFPCVYREIAGIDSIVQAAGRCNREGKMGIGAGRVCIFEQALNDEGNMDYSAPPAIEENINATKQLLKNPKYANDPMSLDAVSKYYSEFICNTKGKKKLDNSDVGKFKEIGIIDAIFKSRGKWVENGYNRYWFAEIAHAFKLIRDDSVSIIIPGRISKSDFGLDQEMINEIRKGPDAIFGKASPLKSIKHIKKMAQQHSVQIPKKSFVTMIPPEGCNVEVHTVVCGRFETQFAILTDSSTKEFYDNNTGLNWYAMGGNDVDMQFA